MTKAERSTGESKRGAHRISTLMRCPAAFAYAYLLNLEPLEPRPPLALGTCVHIGLDTYYREGDTLQAIMNADSRSAFRALDAVKIVDCYKARYPLLRNDHGDLCDEDGKILFVEKEFDLTIGDEVMTRRLDLGLVKNDRLLVVDHKTAARPSSRARQGDLDPTLVTQELVGRQIAEHMGLGWGGFYLNIIPSGNQGDFTRSVINYTGEFLARARRSLLYWLEQERVVTDLFNKGKLDPWAMSMSCQCYPNGFACDYRSLCTEGKLALGRFTEKI